MQTLKPNSTLQGEKYKILSTLGQGGFGITYLAIQSGLERKVAIKEFFMKELCDRDECTCHVTLGSVGSKDMVNRFREKFLKEARNIAKLNHPNIVRIIDVFEENGTAYYVMEYAENGSLAELVQNQGCLSEPDATRYILQVAKALGYIHQQKMNHLDVKPSNILLNEWDEAVLIDFGVSKQYDAETAEGTTTTPVGISHGYSPLEQYSKNGVQLFSPQSDVYALAATLYKLLTGITPPEATEVMNDGVPVEELRNRGVSETTIQAIEKALLTKKLRTQSVAEFAQELDRKRIDSSEATMVQEDDMDDYVRREAMVLFAAEQRAKEEEEKKRKAQIAIKEELDRLRKEAESKIEQDRIKTRDFQVNGVSFRMVFVEGGTFEMKEKVHKGFLGFREEETVRKTTISDFYIGQVQVTQELWESVKGSHSSPWKGEKLPVNNLSWVRCKEFIEKLNELTSHSFRLPTEAEWEYAARGGRYSKGYVYSGSNNYDEVAKYSIHILSQLFGPSEVALRKPNELGLYDMSGNVWEWCEDSYGPYGSIPQTNPIRNDGYQKALRGGGYDSGANGCCINARNSDYYSNVQPYYGMRLCLSKIEL